MHSSSGSKWKDHKYIAIVDGRYIYPGDTLPRHSNGSSSVNNRPGNVTRVASPSTHVSTVFTGGGALGGSNAGSAANNAANPAVQKNRPRSRQKRVVDGTSPVYKREAANSGGSVAVGSGRSSDAIKNSQPSPTRGAPSGERRLISNKTAFSSSSSALIKKAALKEKQIADRFNSVGKSHNTVKKAFSIMTNKLKAAAKNSANVNKGKAAIEKAKRSVLMMPGVSTIKKHR